MSGNDAFDIISVLNLYALAIDARQFDLFDRVFTPDAELDYGDAGTWNDLEVFKKYFAEAHDHFNMSQHFITNQQVVVNGDRANTISYVQARHSRNIDGSASFWEMGGWYDDVFVRTPAGWRIKRRLCCGNWSDGNIRVLAPTGVPPVFQTNVLKKAAAAGGVAFLDAIKMK
jgi:hypothetical protein